MNSMDELFRIVLVLCHTQRTDNEVTCRGQGLVEYAMIISFVAIVVLVVLVLFGPAVGNMFSNVISNI
jgi:pilus assembly protein Flp/PilA